jgi:hypothetical protein
LFLLDIIYLASLFSERVLKLKGEGRVWFFFFCVQK